MKICHHTLIYNKKNHKVNLVLSGLYCTIYCRFIKIVRMDYLTTPLWNKKQNHISHFCTLYYIFVLCITLYIHTPIIHNSRKEKWKYIKYHHTFESKEGCQLELALLFIHLLNLSSLHSISLRSPIVKLLEFFILPSITINAK